MGLWGPCSTARSVALLYGAEHRSMELEGLVSLLGKRRGTHTLSLVFSSRAKGPIEKRWDPELPASCLEG